MWGQKPTPNEQSAQFIQTFDFASIDALDPSTSDGSQLLFDREIPAHIRFEDNSTDNDLIENVRVKVLIQGSETKPQGVRVEVSSDSDLFFFFVHAVDPQSFHQVKEQQSLNGEFRDYPSIIIKTINKCEKQEQNVMLFTIRNDGGGILSVIQLSEYKNLELLAVDCQPASEELVRQHITYRYGAMKSKISMMEGRMQDIAELVRMKNPSLLLHIQKAPMKVGETSTYSRAWK